jgi:hypothetical protein
MMSRSAPKSKVCRPGAPSPFGEGAFLFNALVFVPFLDPHLRGDDTVLARTAAW